MSKKIFILTGAIRSGKTTALLEWAAKRQNIYGVLTPLVNEKKVFMNVHTGQQFEMEASEREENNLTIGRYTFSKRAFEKAITVLRKAGQENSGWLIIDEIGPLELRQKGFYEIAQQLLHHTSLNIILVVREGLVDSVARLFAMKEFEIVRKEQLSLL
jgi:nucleoside-triphosphatase THEP1